LGLELDLGKLFRRSHKEEADPAKAPPEKVETVTPPPVAISTPTCHCQGGRVLIILGNFEDRSIAQAMCWAKSLASGSMSNGHLHVVAYNAPPRSDPEYGFPYVPDEKAKNGWRKIENLVNKSKRNQVLPTCCCFYEEVMIIFHGHQAGGWSKLIENLPGILNRKPIEKLVLWSCKSSQVFFPNSTKFAGNVYEKISAIVAPKPCPCGCVPDTCRAFGTDGQERQCPRGDTPVKILTAGMFNGRATSLQMKCVSLDNPLTSPDGTLREVTVNPDGKITARLTEAGVAVFGANTVGVTKKEDCPAAEDFRVDTGEVFRKEVHLADSAVPKKKLPELPYRGLERCGDEGCLPGDRPVPLKGNTR
jgi:hypothetical protein